MKIITWNMQGSGRNEIKYKELAGLYDIADVVLLQECGRLDVSKFKLGAYTICEHAGAKNQRCSMAILSKIPGTIDTNAIFSSGRPLMHIKIGNVTIGNIHASANDDAGNERARALDELKASNFILGGDFNCHPSMTLENAENAFDLLEQRGNHNALDQIRDGNQHAMMTRRQKDVIIIGGSYRSYLAYTFYEHDKATHPSSGQILDYFVSNHKSCSAKHITTCSSDHHAQMLVIN